MTFTVALILFGLDVSWTLLAVGSWLVYHLPGWSSP